MTDKSVVIKSPICFTSAFSCLCATHSFCVLYHLLHKTTLLLATMNRGRSSFSSSTPKKPYTLAALDKPPILRRNSRGMFMTTEEIERDDARMLAQERARPCSRPPVNKPEEVFPASGWPTGPRVQESEDEELLASEVLRLAPFTPPPIPARSPLRPRPAAAAAAHAQPAVQPDSPSSSLFFYEEEGAGLGFHQGNPWSLTGRLPPVVLLAAPSLPPSAPSEYLAASPSVAQDEGPRGVDYNPDTTGLTSAFSASSSSSGGSLLVSNGTISLRRRRRMTV
ncbi:hypothetical protein QM012_009586 [Aureobasidium pullulans]|uniref:Uncharacterized protein n=1 Tax=Aureobasidium pullulans TaxID=5580 RepID=A0ABR0TIS6_AURPU